MPPIPAPAPTGSARQAGHQPQKMLYGRPACPNLPAQWHRKQQSLFRATKARHRVGHGEPHAQRVRDGPRKRDAAHTRSCPQTAPRGRQAISGKKRLMEGQPAQTRPLSSTEVGSSQLQFCLLFLAFLLFASYFLAPCLFAFCPLPLAPAHAQRLRSAPKKGMPPIPAPAPNRPHAAGRPSTAKNALWKARLPKPARPMAPESAIGVSFICT